MNQASKNTNTLSYLEAWRMLKARAGFLALILMVAFVVTIVALRLMTPHHTAEMIIGPLSTDGVAGRGARLTAHRPDTELLREAPVEIDQDESLSDFSRFLQLMTSQQILRSVLQEHPEFLQNIFPEHWDSEQNRWQKSYGMTQWLQILVGHSVNQNPPTANEAARRLRFDIAISPVGTSAMRRLMYRHTDAEFAVDLLNALYEYTDRYLRQQARKRTQAEIAYIKNALTQVSFAEHRRALANLLAAQEQTQMMISVDLPLAADQIEAASVGSHPDWPPVMMILFTVMSGALLIGLFWIYILEVERENP